jgi:hypothetical protein
LKTMGGDAQGARYSRLGRILLSWAEQEVQCEYKDVEIGCGQKTIYALKGCKCKQFDENRGVIIRAHTS